MGLENGAIGRTWRDAVEAGQHTLVLAWIQRLVGFGIAFVALAVAIGVENDRGPALRCLLVAGLVELLDVQPADHIAATDTAHSARRPEPTFAVELQMMRAEAGVNERELVGLGVIHRKLAAHFRNRE